MLKDKNKFILKNPCEVYIKDKFTAIPNYSASKTNYTKFGDYILSDLFRPVAISTYKDIKYLFTLLDTITR